MTYDEYEIAQLELQDRLQALEKAYLSQFPIGTPVQFKGVRCHISRVAASNFMGVRFDLRVAKKNGSPSSHGKSFHYKRLEDFEVIQ